MDTIDPKGKIILGIAAHPDDLDFGCSGTVAKWINLGATAYYLILTDGTKGSEDIKISADDLKEIRHQEQTAACQILGVKKVYFLDHVDGELENTAEIRKQVIRIIRQLKPNMVFTMDPGMIYDENRGFINHPDHRAAGQIALDCVFPFARNSRTFPELLEEGLEIHSVEEVLLTNFCKANFYVDIEKTIDKKLEALSKHKSQHTDFKWVENWVRERAKLAGKKAGCKSAEGFVRISLRS